MSRAGWVAILVVVAMATAGCCEKEKQALAECEAELAKQQSSGTEDKFTLVIEKDSLATFQPFNNQYREVDPKPDFRDGFLVQIADFQHALHAWDRVELYDETGANFKTYLRGDGLKSWIDIECGTTSSNPITAEMAKALAPVPFDATTNHRRLHSDMQLYSDLKRRITPVTIWAPEGGLRVESLASEEPLDTGNPAAGTHGHVRFDFFSSEACEVRVWTDLDAGAPDETFPDNAAGNPAVAKIVVSEAGEPQQHGGPHQPIWPIIIP